MSDEQFAKEWTNFVDNLKANFVAMYSIVSKCKPSFNGNIITLDTLNQFYLRKLDSDNYKPTFIKLIKETFGYEWDVVLTAGAVLNGTTKEKEVIVKIPTKIKKDRIYVTHIHISNFRCLEDIDIDLRPYINILLGANNVGKTAVIDALRLGLQVGRYKHSLFASIDDFNDENKEVKIDIRFHCPDDIKGLPEFRVFNKETGKTYLELHVRYSITGLGAARKVRQRFWGGNGENKSIDEDMMAIFGFEYLAALRDANAMLKPAKNSKIAELLLNLRVTDTERAPIELVFKTAQDHEDVKALTTEASSSVQAHLSRIALKHDSFDVGLNSLPILFEDLVGGFDMALSRSGVFRKVAQNGLGYNNVLYASTVLGHLKKRRELDNERYHALLIEEPEAHLHPQLEDSLFSYISELGSEIGSQLIITTHSAIISSTSPIQNLILLNSSDKGRIKSTSVALIPLDDHEKRKIRRYLDATKARLFFARSVIFVEGITESLLLPSLADEYFGETDSLTSRGIEVVNIDGISFAPYAKLFSDNNNRLPMKAVILTDRDSTTTQIISPRAKNVLTLKKYDLDVQVSEGRTLEIDLWDAGNDNLMKTAGKNILTTDSNIDTAEDLLAKVKNSNTAGKGDLAQEIIDVALKQNIKLKVPAYMQNAFKWVE